MPVYDLGYKPYQGIRHGASHNAWVLIRQGTRRAWGSVLVKISVFSSFLAILWPAGKRVVAMFTGTRALEIVHEDLELATDLRKLSGWLLLWVFGIALGAGARAISDDLRTKAFQFYFSKPTTPQQYAIGRVVPVAFFVFLVMFGWSLVLTLLGVFLDPRGMHLQDLGLLFPSALQALLVATTCASISVALSATSSSRALTMVGWFAVFLLPGLLAGVVALLTHSPWAYLGSIPELLGVMADTFFRQERADPLCWYHALPVLAGLIGVSLAFLYVRLRSVETIA